MKQESVLSQICTTLRQIRDLDAGFGAKLTDQTIQEYMDICRTAGEHLACPICFLTKGRFSNLHPPCPFPITEHRKNLRCEFCAASIPIFYVPDKRAA